MSQVGNDNVSSLLQESQNSPKNNSKELSSTVINHPGFKQKGGDKNFICEICLKPFAHEYNAKGHIYTHMSRVELEETTIFYEECEYCERIFLNGRSYMRHLKTHPPLPQDTESENEEIITNKSQKSEPHPQEFIQVEPHPLPKITDDDGIDTIAQNTVQSQNSPEIPADQSENNKIAEESLNTDPDPKEFIQIDAPPLPQTFQNDEVDTTAQNLPQFPHEQSENDDTHRLDDISPLPPNGETEPPPPPPDDEMNSSCQGTRQSKNSQGIPKEKNVKESTPAQKSSQDVSKSKHICYFCPKNFKRSENLLEHFVTHTKETPFKFKCSNCSKQFSSKTAKYRHEKQCGRTRKKFLCSFCPLNFSRHYAKINHEKRIHLNVENIKQNEGSTKSMKTPTDPPPSNDHDLPSTLSSAQEQVNFAKNSPKVSSQSAQYETDEIIPKSLLTCKTVKGKLTIRQPHHYSCYLCPRKFLYSANLNRHLATHSEGAHLKCSTCKKYFNNISNLKRHKKLHGADGGRIFPCAVCPLKFNRIEIKIRHEKRIHFKIPDPKAIGKVNSQKSAAPKGQLNDKIRRTEINSTPPQEIKHQNMAQKCYFCLKCFEESHRLIQHLATHTKESPFKCPTCKKEFKTTYHLKRHQNLHRADIDAGKQFLCSFCPLKFTENGNRIQHEKRIHLKTHVSRVGKRLCYFCGMKCLRRIDLNRHLATHTQQTPYKCSRCQKQFKRAYNLKQHLKTHATDKHSRITYENFECGKELKLHQDGKVCSDKKILVIKCLDVKTKTKSGSVRKVQLKDEIKQKKINSATPTEQFENMAQKHSKLRHLCYFCSKNFSQSYHLNRHLLSHTKEAPFKCPTCKKEFALPENLKRHKNLHGADGGKKFPWDFCPKRFAENGKRINHEKTIHLKTSVGRVGKHLCYFCGMKFSGPAHLTEHLATHTLETPNKCGQCQKQFKRAYDLKQHFKTHVQDKSSRITSKKYASFKCPMCRMEFARLYHLKRHEKLHWANGGKIFPCSVCSLQFNRKENRIAHEKRVHLNNKESKISIDSVPSVQQPSGHEISQELIPIPLANLSGNAERDAQVPEKYEPKSSTSPPISKFPQNPNCYFCGKCVFKMDLHLLQHTKERLVKCSTELNKEGSLSLQEKTPHGDTIPLRFIPLRFSARLQAKDLNHFYNALKKIAIPTQNPSQAVVAIQSKIVTEIGSFCPQTTTTVENLSDESVIPSTIIPEPEATKKSEAVAQELTEEWEQDRTIVQNAFLQQSYEKQAETDKSIITHHNTKEQRESTSTATCYFCGKFVLNLDLHLAMTHTKEAPLKCCICKKQFIQKENLAMHEETHGVRGKRKFLCRFCPLRFTHETTRFKHEKNHLDKYEEINISINIPTKPLKPPPPTENNAKKSLPFAKQSENILLNLSNLSKQSEAFSQVKKPFRIFCYFCSKNFPTPHSLQQHLSSHTKELSFNGICKKELMQKRRFKMHEKAHEGNGTGKSFCQESPSRLIQPIAQFQYENSDDFNNLRDDDSRREHGDSSALPPSPLPSAVKSGIIVQEAPFLIIEKLTEESISNLKSSSRIQRKSTPRLNMGYFCGKNLTLHKDLNVHLLTHTKETPYKCSRCKKQFNSKSNLLKHEKIHQEDKTRKFNCSFCPSKFTSRRFRNDHEKVHSKKKQKPAEDNSTKQKQDENSANAQKPASPQRKISHSGAKTIRFSTRKCKTIKEKNFDRIKPHRNVSNAEFKNPGRINPHKNVIKAQTSQSKIKSKSKHVKQRDVFDLTKIFPGNSLFRS